jgi:hypothetical protein
MGVVGMIVERMANLADRVTERYLADVVFAPHLIEKEFAGYEFARGRGQTQQHFHRFGWQVLGPCSTGHESLQGLYEQISKVKPLQEIGLHGVASG